jgi:hypothetical protein
MPNAKPTDSKIVRAAIHPGIGIARIGNSQSEYFIGPEITTPQPQAADYYRDSAGAIKRQAARFHVYGYNAAGEVVSELTADNADITWTVHVANRKAQWYRFLAALDIPEAVDMSCIRRNKNVDKREQLAIDPGPRSIAGKSVSGGDGHAFTGGKFKTTEVPLGEIRTDALGRLIVLGGTGQSGSPSNAPVFDPADPDSFNNADDWYDDTSDGPVTATVSIAGRAIAVDPSWVVVTPPNYAPDIISWRTMYDEMCNVYVEAGMMKVPDKVSFVNDVLPILQRQSNLQWVNAGYAGTFAKGRPWDFNNPALLEKLAQAPDGVRDPFQELRRNILNSFRPPLPSVSEPPTWPHIWPWIYGDAFGSFAATGPGNMLPMTGLQYAVIKRWSTGDFVNDLPPAAPPTSLERVPLAEQPAMLDKAALHFCLADTFHPGCEMTWPMRHGGMYSAPFRIRHRPPDQPEPDYGAALTQPLVLQVNGPLYAQGPGDVTRWMALPWQGDTAFCRSGYDPQFDPYLPTFWAARVPNQVLTAADYKKAIDTALPREERLAAFNRRLLWLRALLYPNATVPDVMNEMIKEFGSLGIVEARPGVKGDPDIPEVIYVESIADKAVGGRAELASNTLKALERPLSRLEQAGWASEAQFHAFRRVRVRGG